eukprot:TRINITY_DN17578_c0_g1_i2.p1 TRINITY_DN17578_c0_g1~~TRINITY_DN17578_c0_g1_i2.p1  ORF type:complete len:265 (+),score=23.43 TRINITY_DN17578_c0_g1_i2:32-826(+)
MLRASHNTDSGSNMPNQSGRVTAENLLSNFMETFADSVPKVSSHTIFDGNEDKHSIRTSLRRMFGREKPVHHLLGGGKSADVLLWRDKKISISFLTGATIVWLLFEWLNCHLLTLCCLGLAISMIILFFWANMSTYINRSPARIPHFALPEDVLISVAKVLTVQINGLLEFLQNVALGRDSKTFIMVVASLFILSMLGSCCNLLTLLYLGFVAVHTLPALYERYEDQVDSFILNVLEELKRQYQRFDSKVISRIPSAGKRRKYE